MDVVAVWDAEELVEPLARWQELGLVPQVPLAVDGGFVTDAFETSAMVTSLGLSPLGSPDKRTPNLEPVAMSMRVG